MVLLLEPSPYDAETRGRIMLNLSQVTRFAVNLYFKCQMFNEIALPEEGGVLDQSDHIVAMLMEVHNNAAAIRQEQTEGISKPKSQIVAGVDPKITESINIGTEYKRRTR